MKSTRSTARAPLKPPVEVVRWSGGAADGALSLLDQTQLPAATTFVDCHTTAEVWDAIKRLVVRGAPAIGVAAAYAMVLAAREALAGEPLPPGAAGGGAESGGEFRRRLEHLAAYLKGCRPTAVNLAWAVDRTLAAANSAQPDSAAARILTEARAIHREDETMCLAIGRHAAGLIERCTGVLTHCNAGALATAGIGTATAGMYVAHEQGHAFCVYCDETRPLLQGSRLTAWELAHAGINAVVITDSMAAQVMKTRRVQMVITGADRIAANGDAANKIGTLGVAILAAHYGIPFYVAAPTSTFDLSLSEGEAIPIEQRDPEEVTALYGRPTAPDGIGVFSPAFDVTPASLIAGIVTDRGIISPVNAETVRELMAR